MIVSIHQPDYIPYPGLFYKIWQADTFVFLDDAQFSTSNIHNWNRIKSSKGELRLKIPIEQHLGYKITEVRTKDDLGWKKKHLAAIRNCYATAEHFKDFYQDFESLIMADYPSLADLNIAITTYIAGRFGMRPKYYRSSEMDIKTLREERVIDICSLLKADTYISGNGAKAYQSEEDFSARGLRLEYTNYHPIEYPQLWSDFLPNMSIIDFIFNCGFDWDLVLRQLRQH